MVVRQPKLLVGTLVKRKRHFSTKSTDVLLDKQIPEKCIKLPPFLRIKGWRVRVVMMCQMFLFDIIT